METRPTALVRIGQGRVFVVVYNLNSSQMAFAGSRMERETSEKLAGYKILEHVRSDACSVSYSALHLGIGRSLKADRNVILKFVWDVPKAENEARLMLSLGGKGGFPCLYHFFTLPYEEVLGLLDSSLVAGVEKPNLSMDQRIATLVTQHARGYALVSTAPALEGVPRNLLKGAWLVQVDGQAYVQTLVNRWGTQEKLKLMGCMIKAVKHIHEQQQAQACGLLNPGNLLFDPDGDGALWFIGWETKGFDAEAWRAPWHDAAPLARATDIYQLALWCDRLLGSEHGAWRAFTQTILGQTDPFAMPTVQSFDAAMKQVIETQRKKKRIKTALVLSFIALIALGLNSLYLWRQYTHQPLLEELSAVEVHALSEDHSAADALVKLKGFLNEPKYAPVRKEVIDSLGRVAVRQGIELEYLKTVDWGKPQAIFLSNNQSFVVYESFAYEVTTPINQEEVISEIASTGLKIRNFVTGNERHISFPRHPLVDEEHDGQFIIYNADLHEVVRALPISRQISMSIFPIGRPRIFGVLLGESVYAIFSRIYYNVGSYYDESVPRKEKKYYVFYDIARGTQMRGPLGKLATNFIRDGLGCEVSGWELMKREVDVQLNSNTPCLEWFEYQAKLDGFEMVMSSDGKSVEFLRCEACLYE